MERTYSLAHLTALGCPPPELIYIASRAGYDYVSLRPIAMGLPNENAYKLAEDKHLMQATKKALEQTGLTLLDVELARITPEVTPKTYLPAMEIAAELGGSKLLSSAWCHERSFIVDFYAELCSLAKPFGLTVDFEFVTWSGVKDLKCLLSIVHEAKQDNCGIMIDTLHFYRSRVTLEELDSIPREWVHFAHLCDAPEEIPTTEGELIRTGRSERLYVGEGAIGIAPILNRLPLVPYSIELPHDARAKEYGYAEHATRCLESAKKYFESHPRADE